MDGHYDIKRLDGDSEGWNMIEIKAVNFRDGIWYKPVVDGKEYSSLAETEDIAYLLGLQFKYLGTNSQFISFVCRMLKIESVWTE